MDFDYDNVDNQDEQVEQPEGTQQESDSTPEENRIDAVQGFPCDQQRGRRANGL